MRSGEAENATRIPLGVVLAFVIGVAIGHSAFTFPMGTLVIFVIAAIAAGCIAAIIPGSSPARRTARLNVLQALQYE